MSSSLLMLLFRMIAYGWSLPYVDEEKKDVCVDWLDDEGVVFDTSNGKHSLLLHYSEATTHGCAGEVAVSPPNLTKPSCGDSCGGHRCDDACDWQARDGKLEARLHAGRPHYCVVRGDTDGVALRRCDGVRTDERLACLQPGDAMTWYRGAQFTTVSGKECERWDSQPADRRLAADAFRRSAAGPWLHSFYEVDGIGDLASQENFCRNPSGSSDGPWCFVDGDGTMERCFGQCAVAAPFCLSPRRWPYAASVDDGCQMTSTADALWLEQPCAPGPRPLSPTWLGDILAEPTLVAGLRPMTFSLFDRRPVTAEPLDSAFTGLTCYQDGLLSLVAGPWGYVDTPVKQLSRARKQWTEAGLTALAAREEPSQRESCRGWCWWRPCTVSCDHTPAGCVPIAEFAAADYQGPRATTARNQPCNATWRQWAIATEHDYGLSKAQKFVLSRLDSNRCLNIGATEFIKPSTFTKVGPHCPTIHDWSGAVRLHRCMPYCEEVAMLDELRQRRCVNESVFLGFDADARKDFYLPNDTLLAGVHCQGQIVSDDAHFGGLPACEAASGEWQLAYANCTQPPPPPPPQTTTPPSNVTVEQLRSLVWPGMAMAVVTGLVTLVMLLVCGIGAVRYNRRQARLASADSEPAE